MADHIHTPDDGRGQRDVYVDGLLVNGCFYADTRRGIADVYVKGGDGLIRLDKRGKRLLSKRLRGCVEVVEVNDG